jgi:focal adhesion kinase 1
MYEPELATRGKVTIELKTNMPVVIRTAQLVTAVHLCTLVDGYCQVYTTLNHSRLSIGVFGDGAIHPGQLTNDPSLAVFSQLSLSPNATKSDDDDYAQVRDPDKLMKVLGRPLNPKDILLIERIGEGQFGDVHKGTLYPDTTEETHVAIKSCKSDSAPEERAKFLQEAAIMKQFSHPHIIKLFGIVTHGLTTFIVMEFAPLGQVNHPIYHTHNN